MNLKTRSLLLGTGLAHLGRVHERQSDPRGADVERVAVHDVHHAVREA